MNDRSQVLKAISLIHKSRLKKKISLYKTALGVVIDKTIAFYLAIFLAYVVFSLINMLEYLSDYEPIFREIEKNGREYFPVIFTAIPLIYVFRSFRKPGVIFSTSEYYLTNLPYRMSSIFVTLIALNLIKTILFYVIIALIAIFLFSFSPSFVIAYMIIFLYVDLMMKGPQWKLFQMKWLHKAGFVLLFIFLNSINSWLFMLFEIKYFGLILLVSLPFINIYLFKHLFKGVNWQKVTDVSDFDIWNMWFISQVSKVKYKRANKVNFFQNLSFRRKPFPYTTKPIHKRLWQIYLWKNMNLVLQLIGVLLIFLVVTQFVNKTIFHIAIAVSIYVYTSVISSFFRARFSFDIVEILPWDLEKYKRTFFPWTIYGYLILLISTVYYLWTNYGFWTFSLLLFYLFIYLFYFHTKVKLMISRMNNEIQQNIVEEVFVIISLVGVMCSSVQPAISLIFVFVYLYVFYRYRILQFKV